MHSGRLQAQLSALEPTQATVGVSQVLDLVLGGDVPQVAVQEVQGVHSDQQPGGVHAHCSEDTP